jgi:hypothetical protein
MTYDIHAFSQMAEGNLSPLSRCKAMVPDAAQWLLGEAVFRGRFLP